jgi:hypothetical protein
MDASQLAKIESGCLTVTLVRIADGLAVKLGVLFT